MVEKIIKKAVSFLGAKEPTGDDRFIKLYNEITGAGFAMSVSWCAIFLTVVAKMVGASTSLIPTFASCDVGVEWFKNKGRYQLSQAYGGTYITKRGDIIFYSSKHTQADSTHVGYVVEVLGNTMKIIEGNKNNAVEYRSIKATDKYIIGYGRVADFDEVNMEVPEIFKEFQCSVGDFQSYMNNQYSDNIKVNIGKLLVIDDFYGVMSRNAALCIWKYELNKLEIGHRFDLKNYNFGAACSKYANYASVRNGSRGVFVYLVQGILRAKGFYYGNLDGNAGTITEVAIRALQSRDGLSVDGDCGADTWKNLFD